MNNRSFKPHLTPWEKQKKTPLWKVLLALAFFFGLCYLAGWTMGWIEYLNRPRPTYYIPPVGSMKDVKVYDGKIQPGEWEYAEAHGEIIRAKQAPKIVLAVVEPKKAYAATEPISIEDKIRAKFGNRAPDAIKMLRTCENRKLDPTIVSPLNKNGTVDVGVFQINVPANDKEEIKRLKDADYNIGKAIVKFEAHNKTFYSWTCGHVVGDYTYVDALRARRKAR